MHSPNTRTSFTPLLAFLLIALGMGTAFAQDRTARIFEIGEAAAKAENARPAVDRRTTCEDCKGFDDEETTTDREGDGREGGEPDEPGGCEPGDDTGEGCRADERPPTGQVRDHLQMRFPRLREMTGSAPNMVWFTHWMRAAKGTNQDMMQRWATDVDYRDRYFDGYGGPQTASFKFHWTVVGVVKFIDERGQPIYRNFSHTYEAGGANKVIELKADITSGAAIERVTYTGQEYWLFDARPPNKELGTFEDGVEPSHYDMVELGIILTPVPPKGGENELAGRLVDAAMVVAGNYVPGVSLVQGVLDALIGDQKKKDASIVFQFDISGLNERLPLYDHSVKSLEHDLFGTGEPRWYEGEGKAALPVSLYAGDLELKITADVRFAVWRERP